MDKTEIEEFKNLVIKIEQLKDQNKKMSSEWVLAREGRDKALAELEKLKQTAPKKSQREPKLHKTVLMPIHTTSFGPSRTHLIIQGFGILLRLLLGEGKLCLLKTGKS